MNDHLEKEYLALEEKLGFYFGRLISYPLIPPEHVYFSLTNRCNLRCKMCDIPKNPSRIEDELPTSKIKDIILQIKDMQIKHLIFSGGEPFLKEDLCEIVEFAVANNIEMVDIITNGILLDDYIIQNLIKIKLNHITISLDGLRETNDEIRGKGVFDKAETNIDKLNYYKSKYNSHFPTVGINFTILDKNIDDILPMIEFARVKRCNIVVFQPILFNNTKMYEKRKNSLWPTESNILKLKEIIKKIVNLKSMLDNPYIYTDIAVLEAIPNYFKGKRLGISFKCYEAIKRLVITYDGKLWSCIGVYGDLKRDDLKKIWFSKKAMRIRGKVKRCKAHCLQDCIYFPSDILRDVREFLRKLGQTMNDVRKEKVKDRLLRKIEHYTNILSAERKPLFLNFFRGLNIRKEIDNLRSIKKEIIKIR